VTRFRSSKPASLVTIYESTSPTLITVLFQAHGFATTAVAHAIPRDAPHLQNGIVSRVLGRAILQGFAPPRANREEPCEGAEWVHCDGRYAYFRSAAMSEVCGTGTAHAGCRCFALHTSMTPIPVCRAFLPGDSPSVCAQTAPIRCQPAP